MIRAVIFDCFGVLTTDGWLAFRERYFETDSAADQEARELNRQSDAGFISHNDFVAGIAQLAKIDVTEAKQLVDGHVRNDALLDYIKDELKPHYKIGLLSNAAGDYTSELFEKWQRDLFDEMTFSFQIGAIKPDARMYETIAAKLGCSLEECIFVDDRQGFTDGAEAVGMKAVWFKNNQQLLQDLSTLLRENDA